MRLEIRNCLLLLATSEAPVIEYLGGGYRNGKQANSGRDKWNSKVVTTPGIFGDT